MIYSFLYVVLLCAGSLLTQKLDATLPPLFSLLVTSSIATLYFNVINRKHLKKMYADCWSNKKSWLIVMVLVLVMWSAVMTGPGKIGASLFNFIYFSWLGVMGFFVQWIEKWVKNRIHFYFGLSLIALAAVHVFFELHVAFSVAKVLGILLAVLGGTASFVYFKQSQSLTKGTSLSATQVLAVRFYLAIVVLMMAVPTHQFVVYFSWTNVGNLVLLAILTLIIPLYFSQKALEKITSAQHSIISSLAPLVTGLLQAVCFHDVTFLQMVIYSVYGGLMFLFYVLNKGRNAKKVQAA